MQKHLFASVLVLLIAILVLSACGPAATPTPEPTPVPVEPTATPVPTATATPDPLAKYLPQNVSGDIISAGSSTVFPLSERMKQRFEEEGFTGKITIDSIGTGAGFERFCKAGETDISNASRKIKSSEVEACQAIGREPIGFLVGIDALAVVVSSENDFVTDVTLEELAKIFSTAEKWSDVRPEWPAEPILRFIPGTDSGTFDYFVEAVMAPANKNPDTGKPDAKLGKAAILAASNLQLSEDDNVLVQGVKGSKYAIGFFGFAYFEENARVLKTVKINGIEPTAQTAEDGTYPLARPLFIYSTAKIMQEKPQVAAFIYFYLTNVTKEIEDVGYFPASEAAMKEALNQWYQAVGLQP
ncbi:MAG: PstS family phosphate ABC transporter substrate-binding protein [Anaerolineales bacterium]|nr:PstS family phosphate ABC transporter substrate-binding protein [Anaerolineales bacterium]MCX7609637.1 PstS family phosphate ABC transporter substrate-binding protein [Anaerolineales bacterium]MDW8227267.1 PstS family phosphate ABC transporter substrate-binding protein [Anaerolineales bacterium]